MNVYDPIHYWAKVAPHRAALAFPGGVVTYSQLCNAADAAAVAIQRAGFRPGELVNVAVVNPAFQLILLMALGRLGVATAMMRPGTEKLAGLTFAGLICEDPRLRGASGRTLVTDHKWFVSKLENPNPARPEPFDATADTLLRLVTTSGSTGVSKAVALTHGMLEDRLRASPLLPESRRVLSMLTPHGSWGFLIALKNLRAGGTYCFAPFPDACLDLCESFRVEFICASVAQAVTLLDEQKKQTRELQSVQQLLVGGSTVAPTLVGELQRLVSRNVIIGYGATESGQIASAPIGLIADIKGAVGYIHPGATVEIVDDNNKPLPQGRSGAVRITGAGAAKSYLAASQDSDGAFRNGWFYPGDTGSLTKDGLLVIDGRTSELVLNKGGFKINPAILEENIRRDLTIEDVGVVAGQARSGAPEIWAAIVRSGPFNAEKMQKDLENELGAAAPDRVFKVDAIPRNEIGKIQYKILRDLLLEIAS